MSAECTPSTGFDHAIRFEYTGATEAFTVPSGVSTLNVRHLDPGEIKLEAEGETSLTKAGGGGGFTAGTVAVRPGESLQLTVQPGDEVVMQWQEPS